MWDPLCVDVTWVESIVSGAVAEDMLVGLCRCMAGRGW